MISGNLVVVVVVVVVSIIINDKWIPLQSCYERRSTLADLTFLHLPLLTLFVYNAPLRRGGDVNLLSSYLPGLSPLSAEVDK